MSFGEAILWYLFFLIIPPYGFWFWYLIGKIYNGRRDTKDTERNIGMLLLCLATLAVILFVARKCTGPEDAPNPNDPMDNGWHP